MNGANRSKRIFSERHFIDNRAAVAAAAAMSQRVFLGNNENFVAAVFSSFSSFQATLFSSIQEKMLNIYFGKGAQCPITNFCLFALRPSLALPPWLSFDG